MAENGHDDSNRTCEECKDWPKSCFACRFKFLQKCHGLHLPVNNAQLQLITSMEFLSSNPIAIRQPQLDFTFLETQRHPHTPQSNRPLARAIMDFSDEHVLPYSNAGALDVYLEALAHHGGLIPLNARVSALLVYFGRDTEALSFIESLIQWPTMRFNKNIWFFCRDSTLDEIQGAEMLHISQKLCLIIIKARVLQELLTEQDKLNVFFETDQGVLLEQVKAIITDYLGQNMIPDQQSQLRRAITWLDEPIASLRETISYREAFLGGLELEGDDMLRIEIDFMGGIVPNPCLTWGILDTAFRSCERGVQSA